MESLLKNFGDIKLTDRYTAFVNCLKSLVTINESVGKYIYESIESFEFIFFLKRPIQDMFIHLSEENRNGRYLYLTFSLNHLKDILSIFKKLFDRQWIPLLYTLRAATVQVPKERLDSLTLTD